MMISNILKEKLLNATGMIIHNDNLYFHSIEMATLIKYNIQVGKLEVLRHKIEFKDNNRFLYTDLIYAHNKIYLCPTFAESIAIYDDRIGKFTYKDLSTETKNKAHYGNDMSFILEYGHFLFFIGICQTDIILKYDIDTDEVEVIDNQFIDQYTEDRRLFIRNAMIYKNKLVIPLYRGDVLYVLDICTGEKEIIQLDEEFKNIMTIDQVMDYLVLTTKRGEMILWDDINHKIVQKEKIAYTFDVILSLVVGEEIIFYLANKDSIVMCYSVKTDKFLKIGHVQGYISSAVYMHSLDSVILNTECGIYEQHKEGTIIKSNCVISDNMIENMLDRYHTQIYLEGNPGYMTLNTYLYKINHMNVKI